ncbi:MAG: sulfurtransferase [Verrucomicrobiae bacterium]|nr:sulfurtransferase [Verrucomicrobiae bacterium]
MKHSQEFLQLVERVKPQIEEVTMAEARVRLEKSPQVRLIDVREDHEWQDGHAEGAMHLGRGIIERDIVAQVPDKATELILYCGGGYRSALVAANLQMMGYQKVFSLAGGFRAIQESGYPIVV